MPSKIGFVQERFVRVATSRRTVGRHRSPRRSGAMRNGKDAPINAYSFSGDTRVATKAEPDAKLELLHDRVNVVVFGAIFGCAFASLQGAWPGHLATTYFSLAYLVVDLALALTVPAMFKSPGPIVMHHLVTIALHLHPILVEPAHAEYASMALLVELNTLVLTLRRLLDYPFLLEVVFWGSWVFLRLVWFPCLAWGMMDSAYTPDGDYYPIPKFLSSTPRVGVCPKKVAWLFVALTALQIYSTFVLLRNAWQRRRDKAD